MQLATTFGASLPHWLIADLPALPRALPTVAEQMRLVNDLADRNWRAGNGGPFAAIVVDDATGELVSVGVNVVLSSGLTVTHAEVTALSLAQQALGQWDLGAGGADLSLIVNWRPCVQCYGATLWSGVRSLVIAGEGQILEDLTGFDEGPLVDDWAQQFEARGIRVSVGIGYDDAISVFQSYGESDSVVYNARGAVDPT